MKTLKMLFVCLSFFMVIGYGVSGQSLGNDYHVGLGLRAGETSGITLKINTPRASSLEFIGGIWSNWLSLTGLYEKRADAFNVSGMRWYYGAGGHAAFETSTYYNQGRIYTRGSDYAIGLDVIAGLEYKIPPIPVAISLDVKPLIEIYRNGDMFFGIDPGIGIKFTF
jgi:hypothetical protein